MYSQTCSKDHLYTKTTHLLRPHFTGPQGCTHVFSILWNLHIKTTCVYKDHISAGP